MSLPPPPPPLQSAKAGGAGPDAVKLEQEEVSAQQQQRLQTIDRRSVKQDDLVLAIDEGVTRLAAIALAMGDEVRPEQNVSDRTFFKK
jgi:hypothetical protein